MRVWPGRPYPLGATWDGAGVNFASFLRARHQGRTVSVRLRRGDQGNDIASRCPNRPIRSGTPIFPMSSPGSSTAIASTAPTSRPRAIASIRTRSSSIPTPRRSAGTCSWDDSLFGYKIGDPDADLSFDDARQRRLRAAGRRRRYRLHLGRRSAAAHALAQDADLRTARQRLHQAASRTCRRSSAAPMPGWLRKRPSSICSSLGVTAVELMPVHHHVDDRHLVENGAAQLLGLQHAGLLRSATDATPPRSRRASRCKNSR